MAKIRAWKYEVEGTGRFPIDMLRYDASWPTDKGVGTMLVDHEDDGYLEQRRVELVTESHEPTKLRWKSFGWPVVNCEEIR